MIDIRTFGCKVNTYDTGLIQKRLGGVSTKIGDSPIHVLNTCAVTAEATKDAVRAVRKLKQANPNCKVVVTGCAAQVDTEKFENLPEADLVVANSHKGQLRQILEDFAEGKLEERVFKSNIFKKSDLEAGGGVESHHTRAFLKIQDGCNSFCTFCVIPFARGKSRSIPIADLVTRINRLHSDGINEVVITGVHIGDYQDETLPSSNRLEDLLEQVLVKTTVPRIRVSSLEPIEISNRLLDVYSDDRMCPHFHMSIQSANSRVLKDMKRKYGHTEVEWALEEIDKRVPNVFVGMDVIAGFPGESDEEFQDTYERLAGLPWTRIHVFPYSPRPGTYATRIKEQHPRSLIKVRAGRLRELSSERYATRALDQIGKKKKVMVLNKPGEMVSTLSRDYWPISISLEHQVQIPGKETRTLQLGQEYCAEVTGFDPSLNHRLDGDLSGVLLP